MEVVDIFRVVYDFNLLIMYIAYARTPESTDALMWLLSWQFFHNEDIVYVAKHITSLYLNEFIILIIFISLTLL